MAFEVTKLTDSVRALREELQKDIQRCSSPTTAASTKTTTPAVRGKIEKMSAEVVDSNPYR